MRGSLLHPYSGVRSTKALVVRGSLARTFGGLASFLALTLLFTGVYVLGDALANPVSAGTAAPIFGAVLTAIAAVLFYFLVGPTRRKALAGRKSQLVNTHVRKTNFNHSPHP